jgi:hypothetical protein
MFHCEVSVARQWTSQRRKRTSDPSASWTSPLADRAREVINWYFAEVPKVTNEVGV